MTWEKVEQNYESSGGEWETLDVHPRKLNEGELLQGVLIAVEDFDNTFIYTFQTFEGFTEKIYGCFQIDRSINRSDIGNAFRIQFTGLVKLDGVKTVKNFRIMRKVNHDTTNTESESKKGKTSGKSAK